MKLVLQKGHYQAEIATDGESNLTIKFADTPGSLSVAGKNDIILFWRGAQLVASCGGTEELQSISEDQQIVRFFLADLQIELLIGVLPWYQLPDFNVLMASRRQSACHLVYLPFMGWHGGAWCDGPLCYLDIVSGSWSSCAAGGTARLLVTPGVSYSLMSVMSEAIQPPDLLFDGKSSLVAAVKSIAETQGFIPAGQGIALALHDFSTSDALALALIRLSWSDYFLYISPAMELRSDWRYWRRLCKNLGISFAPSHRSLAPCSKLSTVHLHSLLPLAAHPATTQIFNSNNTKIIPSELLGMGDS